MPREKHKFNYDAEVYPNFISFIFKDVDTKEYHKFIVFADRQNPANSVSELPELIEFVNNRCAWLIGYNNHAYDDLLLMHILSNQPRLRAAAPQRITLEIYDLSRKLGEHMKRHVQHPEVFVLKKKQKPFNSLDLMLQYNTKDRTSLKQLAVGLKWHKIQDLPFPPDHIILHHEIPKLEDYNTNDVDINEAVMNNLAEKINLRITYTKKYQTNIINSCNSDIGRKIIANYYEKESGIPFKEFSQKRTMYDKLPLSHCISPNISFETREYQRVLERTKLAVINPNLRETPGKKKQKQFEQIVRSKYLTHTMGLGGMHSNGPAEILTECEQFAYIDLDVASFYPWIIINDGLYPHHLGPSFITAYRKYIVEERMRIKKEDPVLAYMLKIAANATFGLTKANYNGNWLYDPWMTTYICVSGQLYLFMLMEALEKYSHCTVVYSNTDGLTVKVPRNEINLFYQICNRWQKHTHFELEFVQYKRMILRDVNNFIMFSYSKDAEKHIKAKGSYVYKKEEYQGYHYPIIAKAVQEYFEKDIPVEQTIFQEKSIYEFMASEKTSIDKFDVVLFPVADKNNPIHLQKTNRWIVTHGNPQEGKLFKISLLTKEKTEMMKGFYVTIMNDVPENMPTEDYHLLYDYYIDEARSLINLTQIIGRDSHVQPDIVQGKLFAA